MERIMISDQLNYKLLELLESVPFEEPHSHRGLRFLWPDEIAEDILFLFFPAELYDQVFIGLDGQILIGLNADAGLAERGTRFTVEEQVQEAVDCDEKLAWFLLVFGEVPDDWVFLQHK